MIISENRESISAGRDVIVSADGKEGREILIVEEKMRKYFVKIIL